MDIKESVSFMCNSEEDTMWFFNSLKGDPISKEQILHLPRVGNEHTGSYYCYGKKEITDSTFVAKAVLNVYGMFVIPEGFHINLRWSNL